MPGIERLAQCDIGEVQHDEEQRLVYLRLYNVTIALEYEEWNDLVEMMGGLKPMEQAAPELEAGGFRCLSCGFESRAVTTPGVIPVCPQCSSKMEPMNEDGFH